MADPYARDVLAALPCDRCGADVPVREEGWTVECPRCFTRLVVPPTYRREEEPRRPSPPAGRPVSPPLPWRAVLSRPLLGAAFAWTLGGAAACWLAELAAGSAGPGLLVLGPYAVALARSSAPAAEPPELPGRRDLLAGFVWGAGAALLLGFRPVLAPLAGAALLLGPRPGARHPAAVVLLGGGGLAALAAPAVLGLPEPGPLALHLVGAYLLLAGAALRAHRSGRPRLEGRRHMG